MIVLALMELVYGLFEILTSPISIPALPDDMVFILLTATNYLKIGASIIMNYTHYSYLITLLGIIIAVDAGLLIYKFVMWVIKKIPMLGIE